MWIICGIMLPLYLYLMFIYKTKQYRLKSEIAHRKSMHKED